MDQLNTIPMGMCCFISLLSQLSQAAGSLTLKLHVEWASKTQKQKSVSVTAATLPHGLSHKLGYYGSRRQFLPLEILLLFDSGYSFIPQHMCMCVFVLTYSTFRQKTFLDVEHLVFKYL